MLGTRPDASPRRAFFHGFLPRGLTLAHIKDTMPFYIDGSIALGRSPQGGAMKNDDVSALVKELRHR